MKVIVAIDDSPYSKTVLDAACSRRWPADTQFKVLTVIEPMPADCECECEASRLLLDMKKQRRHHLEAMCEAARHRIEKAQPSCVIHYEVKEGDPKELIVGAAVDFEADRILVGSHGRRVCPHSLPGSVSRSVANHAHCTVEVIQDCHLARRRVSA